MPDHITTRVEPQAPSREVAIALMRDIADRSGMGDPWSCDSDITESWIKDWTSHIDAHTAAKDAEIATLREQVEAVKHALAVYRKQFGITFISREFERAEARVRSSGVKLED